MAQDQFHREVYAGDRVVFSNRDAGIHGTGMSYGDVTSVDGNQIEIDGDFWINANRVNKR